MRGPNGRIAFKSLPLLRDVTEAGDLKPVDRTLGTQKSRAPRSRSYFLFHASSKNNEGDLKVLRDGVWVAVSGTEYDAWAKGDPEAYSKLKEGVRAWNTWVAEKRRKDRHYHPNLNGLSFSEPGWKETPLWRTRAYGGHGSMAIRLFEGAGIEADGFVPIDFQGAYLNWICFEGVEMPGALLRGAEIQGAQIRDTYLRHADLREVSAFQSEIKADMLGADLRHAIFFETELKDDLLAYCDMRAADFREADLRNTYLTGSDVRNALFTNARVDGANVLEIQYDVCSMDGRYRGIGGLDSTYGNTLWRRDARDQDYLDTLFYNWSMGWLDEIRFPPPPPWSSRSRWKGFSVRLFWPFIVCAAIFVAAWRHMPGAEWPRTVRWITHPLRFMYSLLINGFGKGSLILSWWALDWGRSLWRVAVVGGICVVLLGFWYSDLVPSGSLQYSNDLNMPLYLSKLWHVDIRPWFAAVMGFCTLGLTGLVKPTNSIAAIAMITNVLSGFVTLGLLIAVAGNKFARRS